MTAVGPMILAVDPGVKGAIAATHLGHVFTCNFTTPADMVHQIAEWRSMFSSLAGEEVEAVVYLESVHSSPSAGPKQSFTFGQNFGEWRGIFSALQLPVHMVQPQEWQRMIPGRSGKKDAELKRVLKTHAQMLYPHLKVTLTNADALLIMDYAVRTRRAQGC